MKKRLLVAVVTGLCVLLGIAAYHFLSRDRNTPASTYRVAIAIPVNIRAINTFVDGVRAGLSGGNVEVKEFSAEGDEHRFASVIKSAVLWKPDVLIVFGTQLTDTALGPQFRDSLPRTIAAAISAPPLP